MVEAAAGTLKEGVGTGTTTSGGAAETLAVAGVTGGAASSETRASIQDVVEFQLERLISGLIRMEVGRAGDKAGRHGTLLLLKAY